MYHVRFRHTAKRRNICLDRMSLGPFAPCFIMANLEDFPVHTKVSTGICNVRLARNEHKARFHLNAIISATRWNLCHCVDGGVLSQLPPIFSQLSLLAQIRRRRSAFAALDALLHIGSPQGSANSVGEGEEDTGNGDKLEEDGGDTKTMKGQRVGFQVDVGRLTWHTQPCAAQ